MMIWIKHTHTIQHRARHPTALPVHSLTLVKVVNYFSEVRYHPDVIEDILHNTKLNKKRYLQV